LTIKFAASAFYVLMQMLRSKSKNAKEDALGFEAFVCNVNSHKVLSV